MKYLIILCSVFLTYSTYAQTEVSENDEVSLADEAIQAPPITIEGQYQVEVPKPSPTPPVQRKIVRQKKPLSSSERLKALRERLEVRNRIMIEKKMEQIRFQQEMALAREIEASMNKTIKAIDTLK